MTSTLPHTAPSILPLQLENLCFSAGGKQLLSNINLLCSPKRTRLILGPNGAGKSLLLRLCHGLLEPASGRVSWANGARRPSTQAMVFQRPVMLRRSVRANLDYALSLQGVSRPERAHRIAEALERFGLSPLAERGARLLSGGEQQRLALARAWLTRPEILFLDEPCSALDPSATRQIETILHDFKAEGMTIVMTSHDLGQARRLADEVAFLHHGRLIEDAPADLFFTCPQSEEAARFLAGDLLW